MPLHTKTGSIKADQVYAALRLEILAGRHAPGARLKEVEVARALEVSRTPVRDAFRQLEQEGLVELLPHRGAVVRELTPEDIEELFALRAVLEGHCASQAAARMDAGAVADLAVLHERFEDRARGRVGAAAVDELVATNGDFHDAVVAGSGNRRMATVLARLAIPDAWKQGFWRSRRQREAAVVYHREVVEAIRARDPLRAEAVMKSHIYAAKDFYVDQLRPGEDSA